MYVRRTLILSVYAYVVPWTITDSGHFLYLREVSSTHCYELPLRASLLSYIIALVFRLIFYLGGFYAKIFKVHSCFAVESYGTTWIHFGESHFPRRHTVIALQETESYFDLLLIYTRLS